MDYDVEMLKLYFKEKNYSDEKINELLDSNPFDKEYMEWLKSRNLTGKDLARVIIKNHLINKDTNLQEITSHENDRVSKYLFNKSITSIITQSIRFMPGYTIFMRGIIKNQSNILLSCSKYDIQFLAGECTYDKTYYEKIKEYYLNLSKQLKNCEFIEDESNYRNTCIIRSR